MLGKCLPSNESSSMPVVAQDFKKNLEDGTSIRTAAQCFKNLICLSTGHPNSEAIIYGSRYVNIYRITQDCTN